MKEKKKDQIEKGENGEGSSTPKLKRGGSFSASIKGAVKRKGRSRALSEGAPPSPDLSKYKKSSKTTKKDMSPQSTSATNYLESLSEAEMEGPPVTRVSSYSYSPNNESVSPIISRRGGDKNSFTAKIQARHAKGQYKSQIKHNTKPTEEQYLPAMKTKKDKKGLESQSSPAGIQGLLDLHDNDDDYSVSNCGHQTYSPTSSPRGPRLKTKITSKFRGNQRTVLEASHLVHGHEQRMAIGLFDCIPKGDNCCTYYLDSKNFDSNDLQTNKNSSDPFFRYQPSMQQQPSTTSNNNDQSPPPFSPRNYRKSYVFIPSSCCFTFFFPCYTAARVETALQERPHKENGKEASTNCCDILTSSSYVSRQSLRSKYGLRSEPWQDCCSMLACYCCFVRQNELELSYQTIKEKRGSPSAMESIVV